MLDREEDIVDCTNSIGHVAKDCQSPVNVNVNSFTIPVPPSEPKPKETSRSINYEKSPSD